MKPSQPPSRKSTAPTERAGIDATAAPDNRSGAALTLSIPPEGSDPVSPIAKLLHRIARLVEYVTAAPLIAAGAVMVVVVLAATFSRYVLNNPITWSEELARYLMIWIGLVGASVTMRHGEHIRITAIRILLPRPLRLIGDLFVAAAIGWFLWVMMVEGWAAAERGGRQMSPALGISMMWPLLSVPMAGGLMLVQHAIQTLLMLMGAQNEPEHESPMGGGPV